MMNAFGRGRLLELEKVNDPVFAEKMMGDGIAIELTDNHIYAPISGEITLVFPSKHAYGIRHDDIEILLHLGLDTVTLEGEGFISHVKVGDIVERGQLIAEMDLAFIKRHNIDTTSMCVITTGQGVEINRLGEVVDEHTNNILTIQ